MSCWAREPPPGQAVAAVHEANVAELVAGGFSREAAEGALTQAKDVLRDAVNIFLGEVPPTQPPPELLRPRKSTATRRSIYSYSSDNGGGKGAPVFVALSQAVPRPCQCQHRCRCPWCPCRRCRSGGGGAPLLRGR